ncbi:MAG: DUF4252 domain-containing protein [Gammaproteobacteria bacterium]|nr:DUF4252 domain-containing protein [Gammaproteobacteria bacterium]
MKPYLRKLFTACASIVLLGCGLTAPKNNDGYAHLGSPGRFDTNHTMTLSLGPTLLGFAASHIDGDPETRALLQGLEGVRIKIYEIHGDASRVATRMEMMSLKLREQDWDPIVLIQEEGEWVNMLIKVTGTRISGLTVLSSDSEEAIMVNIMGNLRPELFTTAMAALDIDTPEIRVAVGE